jgi:hypothetical protein
MNSCATLSPVVRAKAGTHNHRFLLGPQASAKVPQERSRGMLGWTAPDGISVPE